MEKYEEIKKKYNSNKTFVQISKDLHIKIKEHCLSKNIKIKDFLENAIRDKL
jgi:hypothetical protein